MSVLIKDMKMPKSCNSCDLLQDYDGDMYCPLNDYLNFGDIENVPDYVMDGCPLSEVPERKKGKWIEDAETYYKAVNEKGGGVDENTPFFTDDDIACSECLAMFSVIDNCTETFIFCPNCGCDMRGEQE